MLREYAASGIERVPWPLLVWVETPCNASLQTIGILSRRIASLHTCGMSLPRCALLFCLVFGASVRVDSDEIILSIWLQPLGCLVTP